MTKDNLIEIIGRIAQYEVSKMQKQLKREMQSEISKAVNNLKVQLLQEMKRSGISNVPTSQMSKIHSEFRKQYEAPTRPTPKYANNPLLNEILTKTQPLKSDELNDIGQVSILDNIGKVKGNNPMTEILTRDYSELVKRMEQTKPTAKVQQPKPNPSLQTEQFRNSIMSKMMDTTGDDIEEDLSWMDKLT